MYNPGKGEVAAKGQGLKLPKAADKALMDIPAIALLGKAKPERILKLHGGSIATDDPNTRFVLDPATGKGKLERTLPLTGQPVPPHVLPEVTGRAERISQLLHKEAFLGKLVEDGHGVEGALDKELGPEGSIAQWQGMHDHATQALGEQRAAIRGKEGKIQGAEALVGQMAAEDQKSKGGADKALQSAEVQAVSDATSNTFLRTVVGGGAGIAKAGAKVVNFVGGLFGKDEPVIDTKAIDKVQNLFVQAPKLKSAKGQLGGKSGELGGQAARAKKPVEEKKQKIAETKAQQAQATQTTKGMGTAVQEGRGIVTENRADQRQWVAKVQKDLEVTRQARQSEEQAFHAEMGQMQAWAAQSFQVRQLNSAVMQSAGEQPQRKEMDPAAQKQVQDALGAVDQTILRQNQRRDELARARDEAVKSVTTRSGHACPGGHAQTMSQAVSEFEQRLAPHLATLDQMKASLQAVEPAHLPAALEAVDKTMRAIEAAVQQLMNAYVRALGELANEAVEVAQAEASLKKQAAAG